MRVAVVLFPRTRAFVLADLAQTGADVARGLAGRAFLTDDEGMLFWMPKREDQTFWMRGVTFPLDLLFLDGGRVIGVLEQARPGSLDVLSIDAPSTMVLEVPGGWARRNGVTLGDEAKVAT